MTYVYLFAYMQTSEDKYLTSNFSEPYLTSKQS